MTATAAVPFRPWADLDAGLVSSIAARCSLRGYATCRAVCGAWRSALPAPLSRPLAVLPADDAAGHPVSLAVLSPDARSWSRLLHGDMRLPAWIGAAAGCRCVGASPDGWLALVAGDAAAPAGPALFNPFTGQEIPLDPSLYEPAHELAPKIVFSCNPTPHDFTAVSLCRPDKVAVQRASDGWSYRDDTGPLLYGAVLVDVAYGDDDKVYCLARDGQVHVLHLNRRRHRRACRRVPPMEVGPLPKLPLGADVFPSPYDVIAQFTDAKNLVLYDGALHQIWRRPSGAGSATVDAPPGGVRRRIYVDEGQVFVLRFDPGNWPSSPCWSVVEAKDLNGHALFVGLNHAAVVPGGDGVSANSVYYWDRPRVGDYEAVVYNTATRVSVRWQTASTGGVSSPVWYFLPAGETDQCVEPEAAEVEDTSVEATVPEPDEEMEHSAHCLMKTMSLLGRLRYSVSYGSPCEARES